MPFIAVMNFSQEFPFALCRFSTIFFPHLISILFGRILVAVRINKLTVIILTILRMPALGMVPTRNKEGWVDKDYIWEKITKIDFDTMPAVAATTNLNTKICSLNYARSRASVCKLKMRRPQLPPYF